MSNQKVIKVIKMINENGGSILRSVLKSKLQETMSRREANDLLNKLAANKREVSTSTQNVDYKVTEYYI
jgi:hypothetical protein